MLPAPIREHAAVCSACALRLQSALESRELLAALLPEADLEPAVDPYFYGKLRAQIGSKREVPRRSLRSLGVLWRDVAVAGLVFAATLSTFLYGLSRTEVPNADSAIAVDVPSTNPYLTPERLNGRATPVDVMVSVLLP